MDLNPIHHPSPAKKMKCSFLYYVQLLIIGWAGRWTRTPSITPLQPKQWNANFCITFNIWCWPDWSMDLNLICHPSPTKKMKCSIFDYVQLLMISQAGQLTQSPSATPLQPIKWNASFWIMFTSDDWPGWLMHSNSICHPSPAKKMKCSLLEYVHFGWSARLVDGLKPHPSPLSSQKMKCSFFDYVQLLMISQAGQWTWTPSTTPLQPKQWNAHFCITFNIWCWPDLSMDLNLIHHPSPAKNMKCSFLGYIHLLMIIRAVWWTQTPSASPLQPIKWNAHFCITFNFWWSAGLVNGLEPHPPPVSCQKNEMLIFWLCSTSDDWLSWSMDSNPIHHPSPPKKMKCSFLDYIQLLMIGRAGQWTETPSATSLQPKTWNATFWITFNFWWSAGLVNGLKPHLPPLSSQKSEMLIFVLHPTCDVGQTGQWTWTSSATPLQPKIWNAHFWITLNFWWLAGLVNGLEPHPPLVSSQKKWNARFWIMFPSDDVPGWLMNLNFICHTSPPIKMKCSIFDYVQLLMISQAGQLTQSPSASPLQPRKWNAHFWIMFNFWWSAGLVNGLKPYLPALSSQ